jgi:hypothetical protein
MRPDIKPISLNLIKLDQENVRFGGDIADNERETIQLLMADPDDARKILRLAEHIAENGLDPTELQLLTPDGDGRYIVLEGNRRLTALKLLQKPDLCPDPRLVRSFLEMHERIGDLLPEEIDCSIVPTREDGDMWIELKHTGENRGIGRVGWDSDIRDERRARQTGVESIGRQIRNLIRSEKSIFSENTWQGVFQIPVTTLTRLFGSRVAQNAFQLEIIGRKLTPKQELKFIAPSVEFAISLFVNSGYNVNDIKSTTDREKFIAKIPKELLPLNHQAGSSAPGFSESTDGSSTAPSTVSEEGTGSKSSAATSSNGNGSSTGVIFGGGGGTNGGKTRARASIRQRKYIFPWALNIDNPRINEIYRDLRSKLIVDNCPNSVSIVFRVFIEVSCDHYIKKQSGNGIELLRSDNKKAIDENSPLSKKIESISEHLFLLKEIDNAENRVIRKRATSNDIIGSVDHLNQFVHSSASQPIPSELNDLAIDYKPLLESVWK